MSRRFLIALVLGSIVITLSMGIRQVFGLLLLLPWMTAKLVSYTILLFGDFSRYAR